MFFPVPSRVITGLRLSDPKETFQSLTITLPISLYQPEQLRILWTLSPPHNLLTDFTGHGEDTTVVFVDLNPGTLHNFTIRIVLASDFDYDVVPSVSGNFTSKSMIDKIRQL